MKKLLAVLIVAALATTASAADLWTNAALDNNFANPANWNPAPASGHDFYVVKTGTDKAILSGNSPWVMDDLYVGYNAFDGELDVTGGTHVLTNRFRFGFGGSAATVNLSGSASITAGVSYATWGNAGSSGDINVTMSDSASVTVDRLTLGQTGTGAVDVDLSGSASLTLTLMDASPASSSGCLRFGDTTHVDGVTVTVGGSATLTTECAYMGWFISTTPGDPNFLVRANDNSPGLLKIDGGTVHLTGSTLNSYSGGTYPDLEILKFEDINGDDLGGRVAMEAGVFDLAGDQETLINDGIRDGYITHTSASPTAPTGLVPVYDDVSITDVVIAGPGDADGDGDVDVSDLGILATNYGTSGKIYGEGNFTFHNSPSDTIVNVTDLGILATYYGTSVASAVPEPSTLCLLIVGALAIVWRRRR